tara:strand:+ start:719 stop:874 length:156 start_codon:yes stop_codon:yes gene_type:complete
MNLEVEKYQGELRYLRERVKRLEEDLAWLSQNRHRQELSYDELTVEGDKFF